MPAKILIVDDRPANLVALEALLAPVNRTIVRASSGEEALKQVLTTEFAVILLDVLMPGMDGFETASVIRSRPRTREIPIIFLTAFESEFHQARKAYDLRAAFQPTRFHACFSRFGEATAAPPVSDWDSTSSARSPAPMEGGRPSIATPRSTRPSLLSSCRAAVDGGASLVRRSRETARGNVSWELFSSSTTTRISPSASLIFCARRDTTSGPPKTERRDCGCFAPRRLPRSSCWMSTCRR